MKNIIIGIIAVVLLVGCTTQIDDGRLNVVSTTGMINDIVLNIGQNNVHAIALMGPGTDPHLYKASEGDVGKLTSADVIFFNGLHLEAKMGELFERMEGKAYPVTANIPKEELINIGKQDDPHVWFDVQKWIYATEEIEKVIIEKDPENSDLYQANAKAYKEKLRELDNYVKNKANEISEEQRILITAHDAFNYFGNAYGFEVRGLQGISTAAEAGTGDVQELVNFIVKNKIKAVFIESSIPERNIKAVQEAAKAKGWNVEIGGELFSDAMGDKNTIEGTYIGMVEHNINTITGALK